MMLMNRQLSMVFILAMLGTNVQAERDEYASSRLTVVIVVDAFASHYLDTLECNLRGGIKTLLEHGVVYKNAYWPHGTVSTAPGHIGLSSGTEPCDHAIIGNGWCASDCKGKVSVDSDPSPEAAVFAPEGFYKYGRSPHNVMVDGVSDNIMMSSQPNARCQVFSFSHKSRAAILTANRRGKAFWLDVHSGNFTSSKAYYKDKLPDWLIEFNKKEGISALKSCTWELCYPSLPYKYDFKNVNNYRYCKFKESIIGKEFLIDRSAEEAYKEYFLMPQSNKAIFDAATCCIRENLSSHRQDRLVVWVCPSQLDKVAHIFGPDSKEAIDSVYHLDLQIRRFIHDIGKLAKGRDTLIVLTADHGTISIPEIVRDDGFDRAWRVSEKEINALLTNILTTEFNLSMSAVVRDFMICFCGAFDELPKEKQDQILQRLKKELLKIPAIKNVWTNEELDALNPEPDQIEYFIKKQRFPGRSGKLFLQIYPFSQLSKHKTGTSHEVPCEADQHVPLIIYRKKIFEKRTVNVKVSMLQFANSLATMLQVPKPSLSVFPILPGLFSKEEVFI